MKIYHIERDWNLSLKEWKKHIMETYSNVVLIQSEGRGMWTVMAD